MARRHAVTLVVAAVLALGAAPPHPARAGDEGGKDVRRIVIFRSGGSWLGVQIADIDAERAGEIGLKEAMGAEVQSVSPGSPAAEAGIEKGDVILEYQGSRIEGVMQLTRLVRETPAGRKATVKVFRDGATKTLQVKVGEREDDRGGDHPGRFEWRGDHDGAHWLHVPAPPDAPEPPEPPMVDLDDLDLSGIMEMAHGFGRPRLGVTVDSLGKQLADYFGVKQEGGALITSVRKGGPAEAAGLKAGDVIIKVDDESIEDASDLHMALRDRRDKALTLTVVRDRRERTVDVPAPPPAARDRGSSDVGHAADAAAAERQAVKEKVRQALDQARAAQEQARRMEEEARREAERARQRALEEGAGARQDTTAPTIDAPGPDPDGAAPVPDEERQAIRRAVEEARRIRLEMQQSGDQ